MDKSKTVNKVVKFWPKLSSRIIDMIIVGAIMLTSAYFMVEKVNGKTEFIETWMFYVWALISVITFFVIFILIPILWNGKTIGNFVSRVKIVSAEEKPKTMFKKEKLFSWFWIKSVFKRTKNIFKTNLTKSIIKREMFFGWAWIILVIGIATIINHTLIIKVASDQKGVVYKGWDAVRIAMFSSLAGIITLVQMVFGVSGLIKKDGISLHDKIAGSKVVWINKFVKEEKEVKAKTIKPVMIKNNSVDWI